DIPRPRVDRHCGNPLRGGQARAAWYGRAPETGPHGGQRGAAAEPLDGRAEISHALVAPRRAQEHHDRAWADAEPRPRFGAVVTYRIPGVGVAHVRNQRSAEP